MGNLEIQIKLDSSWRTIGEVRLLESEILGLNASCEFYYDIDYAIEYSEQRGLSAVSVHTPVSTEPYFFQHWPPFLLDLFPQGAALEYAVNHYRIADRPENYWKILEKAKMNPPGNLRVVTSQSGLRENEISTKHEGFTKEQVTAKGAEFLNYMIEMGAPVAGTTGAGGAAPKFLLRVDQKGRFHADGALEDSETKSCILVKFPRGKSSLDKKILKAEKIYMDLAKMLGFSTFAPLQWDSDCLFIERFDREFRDDTWIHLGLESFYSMIGLAEFGSRLSHETYLDGLMMFSTSPQEDVIEYCLRDLLNQMLGNTDNHGRNQSLLKRGGEIRLSPIYDFAPMKLDPEGIVRSTRWSDDIEGGDIAQLTKLLESKYQIDSKLWISRLDGFYKKALQLDDQMKILGLDAQIHEACRDDREKVLEGIRSILGGWL